MMPMIVPIVDSKYRDPTLITLQGVLFHIKEASLNLPALRRHGYGTQRWRNLPRQCEKPRLS